MLNSQLRRESQKDASSEASSSCVPYLPTTNWQNEASVAPLSHGGDYLKTEKRSLSLRSRMVVNVVENALMEKPHSLGREIL